MPTTVDADPASPELLDAEVGPVCPGCVSGGETSDFEGETHEECARFGLYTPVSDDVARELGFDVDGIRALLVRDFATSLRWTRLTPTPGVYRDDPGEPPTGYVEQTGIAGSLRLLGAWLHRQTDPRLCDSNGLCQMPNELESVSCAPPAGGSLVFDVGLELATADGAIRLAAVTRSGVARSSQRLTISFVEDLSEVEGTLRVRPTRAGTYYGRLRGTLELYADQVRGALTATLESEGRAGELYWRSTPIEAKWPDDACSPATFPIGAGTAEGDAALAMFEERFSSGRARLLGFSPFVGVWEPFPSSWAVGKISDSTDRTWVSLQVAETARPLCRSNTDGGLTFEVQARVTSSDGRLDWAELMQGSLDVTLAANDNYFGLSWSGVLAEDDPRWQSSLSGVDLQGGRGGRVQLSAHTGISTLEAFTVTACEHDPNCLAPDAPRTSQRAAVLHWSPARQ